MPALLVLVALLLASPATAAEWNFVGPDGGPVFALALQPGSSNILYAGTWAGVLKSVDGGATWQQSLEPPPVTPVLDIAVDPSHPDTLYAVLGTYLYKSTDGGAHWTGAGQGLLPVNKVEIAPGGVVYAATVRGVFRSTDGGASWEARNQGLPAERNVRALEIDPSRPERLYAGLSHGGLYRTSNGGSHWTAASGLNRTSSVDDVAVSPASSKILYAATPSGVARSLDGGATWLAGSGLGFAHAVAPHPSLPGTVYAGSVDGVYKSIDQGKTWTRVSVDLTDANVQALVIDPAAPATLWAGTVSMDRLGGVFRSTDAGVHWAFRSKGLSTLNVGVLEFDPSTPGTLFAVLGSFGLARSRDRGLHWTALPVPPGTGITDVEVDPVDPSIVYALRGAAGPLLRSTDGGDSWSPLETAPPVLFDLEIDPDDPSVLHGGGYGFYKSVDAGATWVKQTLDTPLVVNQIEIAPGVLYAATSGQDPRLHLIRIYRSRDEGQTWEHLVNAPVAFRLAVSPSNPAVVYASSFDSVIRTTDGGDTWQKVSDLPRVISLAVAPGDPQTVYAAVSDNGVLVSTDGGATWSPIGEGLPESAGTQLVAVDPHDSERLYAGVLYHGLAALFQPESCDEGPTTLCLRGRFRVEVAWTDFQGNSGSGQAIPMTNETGGLWFFDPANVELVVKVLDGRDTNGKFWVFAASLTSVEFTLTVTDIETGKQRVYYNPSGKMASFGDTEAF